MIDMWDSSPDRYFENKALTYDERREENIFEINVSWNPCLYLFEHHRKGKIIIKAQSGNGR